MELNYLDIFLFFLYIKFFYKYISYIYLYLFGYCSVYLEKIIFILFSFL